MFRQIFCALAIGLTSISSCLAARERFHVMVDPGHGGTDTGAARGDLKEKEIALKVSTFLADLLRSDPRFTASLTRTSDKKVTLSRRTKMAEDAKADLFVSVHVNSSTDAKVRGTEIYFQNQLPADEEALYLVSREHESDGESEDAATPGKSEPISVRTDLKRILEDLHRNHRIQTSSELSKTLFETLSVKGTGRGSGHRTIRQAPFQVVANIGVPSVLVELGFISHPQEGRRLAQEEYQRELAQALFEGLVKFKETMDNKAARPLN